MFLYYVDPKFYGLKKFGKSFNEYNEGVKVDIIYTNQENKITYHGKVMNKN